MMDRPNILWICTDQQRYDTIGCLGNPHIRTPNIDRLCAEGTAFTHAYCQSPICTPSRASFLTGLYPSSVHCNINGNRRFNIPEKAQLVTHHLSDLGYRCGLVGKLHLSSAWEGHEERIDDGYQVFHHSQSACQHMDLANEYTDWLDSIGKLDEVVDQTNRDDELRQGTRIRENIPFELHHTTWCADRTIDFIQENNGRPWLLSLNIFDPHGPFDAPDDFRRPYETPDLPAPLFSENDFETQTRIAPTHMFQSKPRSPGEAEQRNKASYYGMIDIIDRNVGRLLDCLEETGQRENTLVIFTSDHGEMLGDHGLTGKGCRFYEGLVRVPLIFSWPGHIRQTLVSDALVELTDIAATLTDIAGKPMEWMQGRSLMPIMSEATPAGPGPADAGATAIHRDFVRCEFYDVLDMNWGSGKPPEPKSYATMYRNRRYKLVTYHGSDFGELYDLENDPDEQHNLWEDPGFADVRFRLLKKSFDESIVIADPGSRRIGRF